MAKFHINKHGVPAPCKAQKGNCQRNILEGIRIKTKSDIKSKLIKEE